jgi:TATA-binding protein-associated factor
LLNFDDVMMQEIQAVASDFRRYHITGKDKRRKPWEIPRQKAKLEGTIFGLDYCTLIIDEGHHMRNIGALYWAAICLRQRSATTVILTATPLQTNSKVSCTSSLSIHPI